MANSVLCRCNRANSGGVNQSNALSAVNVKLTCYIIVNVFALHKLLGFLIPGNNGNSSHISYGVRLCGILSVIEINIATHCILNNESTVSYITYVGIIKVKNLLYSSLFGIILVSTVYTVTSCQYVLAVIGYFYIAMETDYHFSLYGIESSLGIIIEISYRKIYLIQFISVFDNVNVAIRDSSYPFKSVSGVYLINIRRNRRLGNYHILGCIPFTNDGILHFLFSIRGSTYEINLISKLCHLERRNRRRLVALSHNGCSGERIVVLFYSIIVGILFNSFKYCKLNTLLIACEKYVCIIVVYRGERHLFFTGSYAVYYLAIRNVNEIKSVGIVAASDSNRCTLRKYAHNNADFIIGHCFRIGGKGSVYRLSRYTAFRVGRSDYVGAVALCIRINTLNALVIVNGLGNRALSGSNKVQNVG